MIRVLCINLRKKTWIYFKSMFSWNLVLLLSFTFQGCLNGAGADILEMLGASLDARTFETDLLKDRSATSDNHALNEQSFDLSALKNLPNILLKKQTKVKNSDKVTEPIKVDPLECVESHFFHPFSEPFLFPDEEKTKEMKDTDTCSWNFIGSEACVPKLSCPVFNLPGNCDTNHLLVRDGYRGEQRFCGDKGPAEIIAADNLRDLYVVLKGNATEQRKIECKIVCTNRGKGEHLTETVAPQVQKKCLCGQKPSSDRIVNGYVGKRSEYPWLVAVVEAQTRQPFCGASILNDRFILTAAHCFKGKYMDYRRVQLILQGEILDIMPNAGVQIEKPEPRTYPPEILDALDKGNNSVRVSVDEIFIHPLYVSETNDFDIALVRTVERINITTKTQRPVCLPPLGSYGTTFAHKGAIVAGWGLPSAEAPGTNPQLMKLNVTIFSQKLCKEYYVHRVNKRMMCAGYKEGGRDSCMGDSGGPLVVELGSKVWTQVGTVSWGEGCAVAENPGVYYRTTETGQWINQISNSQGAKWCEVPPTLRLKH